MGKIDELSINRNALSLIDNVAGEFIDLEKTTSNCNEKEVAMINIGYIKGVCTMAYRLKRELDS